MNTKENDENCIHKKFILNIKNEKMELYKGKNFQEKAFNPIKIAT